MMVRNKKDENTAPLNVLVLRMELDLSSVEPGEG
jgi:hypothetical protein